MHIALVTDAWRPQVNGVVTTLSHTQKVLQQWGHTVRIFSPQSHRTMPCPTYPEIRVALWPGLRLGRMLDDFEPDAIHIATEGPLGAAARRHCQRNGLAFTTSYHTQFPQYVRKRVPVPESWCYRYLRRHHGAARRTLVATVQQRLELVRHGFENVVLWSRGVDTEVFRPHKRDYMAAARPIWMYAGRVAVEKNLEAFLELDLPGTKCVVGDGPDLNRLRERYPRVRFVGYKFGDELARYLSSADVFLFPSRTDTFGLVMLEAMACGTPVAAFPVTGPIDVVRDGVTGALDEDLMQAAERAYLLSREDCRRAALAHSWERATSQFYRHMVFAQDGSDVPPEGRCRQRIFGGLDSRPRRASNETTGAAERPQLHPPVATASRAPP